MASLKSLRVRIKSVKSTQKITKAMKMVAASKLRRAREQAEAARPYAERMERTLAALAAHSGQSETAPKLLIGNGKDNVHLLVVATSDRGLCGSFNSSIVKAAKRKAEQLIAEGKTLKILCIGRKGSEQLKKDYGKYIVERIEDISKDRPSYALAHQIAAKIMKMFDDGEFDVCSIVYNQFKSAISLINTVQQLIPLPIEDADEKAPEDGVNTVYEFEPKEDVILADLLPRNLAVQIYRVLLENAASEQGARMTAMDNATRNAGEMIKKLTLTYNRTRQAAITKELIEIITGAEAV